MSGRHRNESIRHVRGQFLDPVQKVVYVDDGSNEGEPLFGEAEAEQVVVVVIGEGGRKLRGVRGGTRGGRGGPTSMPTSGNAALRPATPYTAPRRRASGAS